LHRKEVSRREFRRHARPPQHAMHSPAATNKIQGGWGGFCGPTVTILAT